MTTDGVLRAIVRRPTGATRQLLLGADGVRRMGDATRVEIVGADGGYLLLRFDASGAEVGDTWHATIQDAQRQARMEYAIEEGEWVSVGVEPERS